MLSRGTLWSFLRQIDRSAPIWTYSTIVSPSASVLSFFMTYGPTKDIPYIVFIWAGSVDDSQHRARVQYNQKFKKATDDSAGGLRDARIEEVYNFISSPLRWTVHSDQKRSCIFLFLSVKIFSPSLAIILRYKIGSFLGSHHQQRSELKFERELVLENSNIIITLFISV